MTKYRVRWACQSADGRYYADDDSLGGCTDPISTIEEAHTEYVGLIRDNLLSNMVAMHGNGKHPDQPKVESALETLTGEDFMSLFFYAHRNFQMPPGSYSKCPYMVVEGEYTLSYVEGDSYLVILSAIAD